MKRGEPPKRKTPLKRATKPLKRVALKLSSKPLPKRSKKKLAALGEEIAFRDAVRDRAQGLCEVYTAPLPFERVADICGTWTIHDGGHAHHVLPRSKGGKHVLENGLYVCARAHDWIHHQHPKLAREWGLLR